MFSESSIQESPTEVKQYFFWQEKGLVYCVALCYSEKKILFFKEKYPMEYELKSTFNTVVRAEKECDVYCPICHKLLHVQAGDVIPRCCGKVMQVME